MSRSRSRSPANIEDKISQLKEKIEDFASDKRLDDRATRILMNMHPIDVKKVMSTAFPQDCRSTTAFVVSVIRKVENEAGRPQGYRWDGRSWSEPAPERGERRGRGGGDSRARSPPPRRNDRGGGGGARRGRSRSRSDPPPRRGGRSGGHRSRREPERPERRRRRRREERSEDSYDSR